MKVRVLSFMKVRVLSWVSNSAFLLETSGGCRGSEGRGSGALPGAGGSGGGGGGETLPLPRVSTTFLARLRQCLSLRWPRLRDEQRRRRNGPRRSGWQSGRRPTVHGWQPPIKLTSRRRRRRRRDGW